MELPSDAIGPPAVPRTGQEGCGSRSGVTRIRRRTESARVPHRRDAGVYDDISVRDLGSRQTSTTDIVRVGERTIVAVGGGILAMEDGGNTARFSPLPGQSGLGPSDGPPPFRRSSGDRSSVRVLRWPRKLRRWALNQLRRRGHELTSKASRPVHARLTRPALCRLRAGARTASRGGPTPRGSLPCSRGRTARLGLSWGRRSLLDYGVPGELCHAHRHGNRLDGGAVRGGRSKSLSRTHLHAIRPVECGLPARPGSLDA